MTPSGFLTCLVLAATAALAPYNAIAATTQEAGSETPDNRASQTPSPYLLIFAGDWGNGEDEDFLAVVDVRPGSSTSGRVVASHPIGLRSSMPHHTEYELPPAGELLFMNAHHAEQTLLVDISQPLQPRIVRRLQPPPPFRFTHDYLRLANGNRLVGFLRSEGASPEAGDTTMPGGHGGIAEYTASGELIRTASAAADGLPNPVRPYAFAMVPSADRLVTTSAPMMESSAADVVQVWRYSDFSLLHTIPVPPGFSPEGTPIPGAAEAPFEPRLMPDGSVLINTYGCALYRLTGIQSEAPQIAVVHTIAVAEPASSDAMRGACGVAMVIDHYWIQPVGDEHVVITFDIADPAHPREVSRLVTPADFRPHWMARDPRSARVVIGAELGGERGMFVATFDSATGALLLDDTIRSADGRAGYVDLQIDDWPHGRTGHAWGHAALFLSQ